MIRTALVEQTQATLIQADHMVQIGPRAIHVSFFLVYGQPEMKAPIAEWETLPRRNRTKNHTNLKDFLICFLF